MTLTQFFRWLLTGTARSETTHVTRISGDLRRVILEASPEDLKDIQLWLKQRMDTDWIKAHNKGLLP